MSAKRRAAVIAAAVWISYGLATTAWAQNLQLTSTSNGVVVNPGQTLSIAVTVSGGLVTNVFVVGENPIGWSQALVSPPYQFTIQIPAGISPRNYHLTATGVDASGQSFDSDPVTIDVERDDAPVSIDSNLSSLNEAIGDTGYLRVNATYSDASTLDVTESSLVSYASDTPTVATVDNVGRVTAVAPGAANITVTYGTLSKTVPVFVPAPLTVWPAERSVYVSQTAQFYAQFAFASDAGTDVSWSLDPLLGTIDANGLYTAPSSVDSYQGVFVTATSQTNPALSGTARIWICPPVSVAIMPASATMLAGQHLQLSTNVSNDGGTGVIWSVTPPGIGSFQSWSEYGNSPYPVPYAGYAAPAPITSSQTITISATSVYDNGRTGFSQITLLPSVALSVSPSSATIYATATLQLTPTLNYSSTGTVAWSVSPNGGTITASGLYTAPADVTPPQTITVTATSVDQTPGSTTYGTVYTATTTITVLPQPVSAAITVPGNLQASVISNSEIDLVWTPSTESGASIVGYHIFRNGTWTATSATSSYADRGLLSSTAYTYTVAAFDANWNTSAKSAAASGTTLAGIPNLVAHYNFDEGAGTTLYDSSGNGNNGAITGTAAWSNSGKMGGALVFDGTTNFVSVPSASSLNLTTGMTLEAWVNPAVLSASGVSTLIGKYLDGTTTGEQCFALYLTTASVNFDLQTATGMNFSSGESQAVPLNTWTHVASRCSQL